MPRRIDPFRFIAAVLAGWANEQQQNAIEYLREENRVLRDHLGGRRIRFTDNQRLRLAEKAKGVDIKRYRIPALLGFITLALAAAGVAQQGGRGQQPPPLQLMVNGFADGTEMPAKYTCYGQPAGITPALEWKSAPPGTQSFLLLMHDLEPHPGKGLTDITHWLIWNIPGTATGLPDAVPAGATLADGSHQVKRGNGAEAYAGYFGPCAPPGSFHHYAWELLALDKMLDVPVDATRADVMKATDGHILGSAEWFGLLHRDATQPGYRPR